MQGLMVVGFIVDEILQRGHLVSFAYNFNSTVRI